MWVTKTFIEAETGQAQQALVWVGPAPGGIPPMSYASIASVFSTLGSPVDLLPDDGSLNKLNMPNADTTKGTDLTANAATDDITVHTTGWYVVEVTSIMQESAGSAGNANAHTFLGRNGVTDISPVQAVAQFQDGTTVPNNVVQTTTVFMHYNATDVVSLFGQAASAAGLSPVDSTLKSLRIAGPV